MVVAGGRRGENEHRISVLQDEKSPTDQLHDKVNITLVNCIVRNN
jgi:hypothetical protein